MTLINSDGDITLEKAADKARMSEQAFLEAAKKVEGYVNNLRK